MIAPPPAPDEESATRYCGVRTTGDLPEHKRQTRSPNDVKDAVARWLRMAVPPAAYNLLWRELPASRERRILSIAGNVAPPAGWARRALPSTSIIPATARRSRARFRLTRPLGGVRAARQDRLSRRSLPRADLPGSMADPTISCRCRLSGSCHAKVHWCRRGRPRSSWLETEEAIEAVIDGRLPSELADSARVTASRCERTTACSWTPFATARCPV